MIQQIWFKVGSANEREAAPADAYGTTGLSHFFEHLMFRGTEAHPNYFEELSRMGGQVNAFTWLDETVYWEKLPSRFLEPAIEMEADRLKNLKMDFLNLEPEREVVKSERLMRTDNRPAGKLDEVVTNAAFTKSPYRWPTVGWVEDLNRVPIEEAEAYFKTHYLPNNAYAVFVGDVDPDRVVALLDKHLGDIEPGEAPPEPDLSEPEQKAERRVSVLMGVKAPLVQIAFPSPSPDSEDWMRFEVLDALLTSGRSSLLQRELVYGEEPLAVEVDSFLFPMRGRHPYMIVVQGLPGIGGARIVSKVRGVLDRLVAEELPREVLDRAVARLRGRLVRYMKSISGRAHLIGFSVRATGDPLRPFKNLEAYGKVTPAQIQELATLWLPDARQTTGTVLNPEWIAEAAVAAAPDGPRRELLGATLDVVEQLRAERLLQREIDLEEEAVRLLGDRAAQAKARYAKDGDPQKAPEVDAYLKESEKGTLKRMERLAQHKARLRKMKAGRSRAAKDLSKSIRRQLRQREDRAFASLLGWLAASPGSGMKPPPALPPCTLAVDHALAVALKLKAVGDEEALAGWVEAALAPLTEGFSDPSGECGEPAEQEETAEPGEPAAAAGAPALEPTELRAKDLLWQLLPLRATEETPAEGEKS